MMITTMRGRILVGVAVLFLGACGGEEASPFGGGVGSGGAGGSAPGGARGSAGASGSGSGGSTASGGAKGSGGIGSAGGRAGGAAGAGTSGGSGGIGGKPGPGCGTCEGTCSNGYCVGVAVLDCQIALSWIPERSALCEGRKNGSRCAICTAPDRPSGVTQDCTADYADKNQEVLCVTSCDECSGNPPAPGSGGSHAEAGSGGSMGSIGGAGGGPADSCPGASGSMLGGPCVTGDDCVQTACHGGGSIYLCVSGTCRAQDGYVCDGAASCAGGYCYAGATGLSTALKTCHSYPPVKPSSCVEKPCTDATCGATLREFASPICGNGGTRWEIGCSTDRDCHDEALICVNSFCHFFPTAAGDWCNMTSGCPMSLLCVNSACMAP